MARLSPENFPAAMQDAKANAEWACPKCRHGHPSSAVPQSYYCFCGKQQEPTFDPWVAPHSCGDTCRKPLSGGCGHSCLLLCHPGPCPPCPLVVDARCFCARKSVKTRCGQHEFSCGEVCNKALPCGHRCPARCHAGACPACTLSADRTCKCGAERRKVSCQEKDFHCARVCGKQLPCGRHKCDKVCHDGGCGGCPFEGQRSCPCGKVIHAELACDEQPPPCGGTCGKLLPCGLHRCQERCHYGDCTKTCREMVTKKCRCGKSERLMQCHAEFRCEAKCTALRGCGRHACKRKCCDGSCPPCDQPCGRKLRCSNHKCPAMCHAGLCRPCPLTYSISCACGASSVVLPCGTEARAAPPQCRRPCPVPATCRHARLLGPHRCHYGACPPCPLACGAVQGCGHACPCPTCHDPRPPAIPDFQRPPPPKLPSSAPGTEAASNVPGGAPQPLILPPPPPHKEFASQVVAKQAAAMLAAVAMTGQPPSSCPACAVPLPVRCVGGHVEVSQPCSQRRAFPCDRPCGRPLACGNHMCTKPCHAPVTAAVAHDNAGGGGSGGGSGGGEASASTGPARPPGEPCMTCTLPCELPRSCPHPCPLPCHRGACPPCETRVSCACLCGKSTMNLTCHQLAAVKAAAHADGAAAALLCCGKPCHKQLLHCPHPCRATCHAGACPSPEACGEEVVVRCECRRQRSKWRCGEVQAALERQGRARTYDASTSLRGLLACDEECGRAAAARLNKSASSSALDKEGQQAEKDGDRAAVEKSVQPAAEVKKLTRAEREAAAAMKAKKKLQQERLRKTLYAVGVLVVLLVGVGLGLLLYRFLSSLDKHAQARWKSEL